MKFLRKLLPALVLFTITCVSAKKRGGGAPQITQQPQLQPKPSTRVNQPVQQQPIQSAESYKGLVAFVKKFPNAWDNANARLKTDFVNTMIQKAQAAHLDDFQLEALLQTARDFHGIFSGNQNKDIATLQSVNNQIAAAISQI
jgi:hypothetical protein